jgi:thioredoxin 1
MKPVEITAENLEDHLEKGIVLLDFWAAWCGPCRRFAPIFEAAAAKHPDLVFGKVDTEAQRQLAAEFRIMSIPTVAAFKEGVLVFSQPGMLPATSLEQLIEQLRSLDMKQVREQIAARTQVPAAANQGR